MDKRKFFALSVALFVALARLPAAFAHAFPDHSVPAVGGVVGQSPAELRIWFTQKLEPSFSGVEVLDGKGVRVDQGDAKVDAQDPTLLRVSLKPLASGTYKVVWHVVSIDTHATQGDFAFTVKG